MSHGNCLCLEHSSSKANFRDVDVEYGAVWLCGTPQCLRNCKKVGQCAGDFASCWDYSLFVFLSLFIAIVGQTFEKHPRKEIV